MKNILTLAALVLACACAEAQTLIPYLGKNGKYGYASEKGEVVIAPEFDFRPAPWPAADLSTTVNKDKTDIILLRNGMQLPKQGYDVNKAFAVKNYTLDPELAVDSLGHLLVVLQDRKMTFVDLRSRDTKEYLNYYRVEHPDWFLFTLHERVRRDVVKFRYGVFQVYKAPGKINFIDEDLKEIFPRDFEAGTVSDSKYFILAENQHKMAIGDRKGKIVSSYFQSLQATSKEGFFIVNNGYDLNHPELEHSGLMQADGKLVIDTIYRLIEALPGGEALRVRRGDEWALMDYKGKFILPFSGIVDMRWAAYQDFLTLRRKDNRKMSLINGKAEVLLKQDFDNIETRLVEPYGALFLLSEGPMLNAVRPDGQLVFRDSLYRLEFAGGDHSQWLSYKNAIPGVNTHLKGIRNLDGSVVLKEKYQDIKPVVSDRDPALTLFHIPRLNNLFGLYTKDGKEILACEYAGIEVQFFQGDTIVWRKAQKAKTWSAYDLRGHKLPYPDYHLPNAQQRDLVSVGHDSKGKPLFILADGSTTPKPERLNKLSFLGQYRKDSTAFLLFGDKNEAILVYNDRLKPILPEGYTALRMFFDKYRLEQTGLLPVYSKRESDFIPEPLPALATPSKSEEKNPAKRDDSMPDVAVEEQPVSVMETPPARSCGILNARGEWVLPPKKDVHYIPISKQLVIETPYREYRQNRFLFSGTPYKIHRVNQIDTGTFEVGWLAQEYFLSKNPTLLMGKVATKSGIDASTGAYFDASGKQLTPFYVNVNSVPYLRTRNLVKAWDGTASKQMLLNQQGKEIHDFSGFECSEAQMNGANNHEIEFIAARNEATKLYGLLDSTAQIVLPYRFKDLKIVLNGKFLSASNAENNSELLNWKGENILSASGIREYSIPIEARNGYHILLEKGKAGALSRMLLLSNKNEVLRSFSYEYGNSHLIGEKGYKGMLVLLKEGGKEFWGDLETGKIYRE